MITIYFDKGRRMIFCERARLLQEIESLTQAGHVISSVEAC